MTLRAPATAPGKLWAWQCPHGCCPRGHQTSVAVPLSCNTCRATCLSSIDIRQSRHGRNPHRNLIPLFPTWLFRRRVSLRLLAPPCTRIFSCPLQQSSSSPHSLLCMHKVGASTSPACGYHPAPIPHTQYTGTTLTLSLTFPFHTPGGSELRSLACSPLTRCAAYCWASGRATPRTSPCGPHRTSDKRQGRHGCYHSRTWSYWCLRRSSSAGSTCCRSAWVRVVQRNGACSQLARAVAT